MRRTIKTLAEQAMAGAYRLADDYARSAADEQDAHAASRFLRWSEEKRARGDAIKGDIARREASPSWQLEIDHVMERDVLVARESRIRLDAERRARKELLAAGEAITPDAVAAGVAADEENARAVHAMHIEWLRAALKEGEVERLMKLGGPDVIMQAAAEVAAAQWIGTTLGEG